ncbi:MAG: dienelactone hydrolase family protein [Gammaproteobacteria bacterium]|nr:dienelactone hydrolase family protein [Gammaproteobacteria bacterium]
MARLVQSLLVLVALSFPTLGMGATEWVRFDSALAENTPLRTKLMKERGLPMRRKTAASVYGELFQPEGEGPFPALVLLHGCFGIEEYQREWAQLLSNWGYVVLLVDSFEPRLVVSVCEKLLQARFDPVVQDRVNDAYGALTYLAERNFVDADRVGLMGWANDAVLGAIRRYGAQQYLEGDFRAAVAIYPDCGFATTGAFTAPVLVLVGGRDDWTPARPCEVMAEHAKDRTHSVTVQVYPNALHGFDNPALGDRRYFPEVSNLYKNPARGATLGYSAADHVDAQERVQHFLAAVLGEGKLDDLGYTDGDSGHWVVDPRNPGPHLPPAGRSVFDQLFTTAGSDGPVYDVPFPFTTLLAKLETALAPPGTSPSPLKKTLIPLGRSLQRDAAAPKFFKHPRIVVAVDTEPDMRDGVPRPYLKDRLFMGYQEKANVLEVISYNEHDNRFEFQVVQNYGAELEPQVKYANRNVCMSCHQNGGPMFAKFGWDETTSSRRIIRLLTAEQPMFYDTPVLTTMGDPPLIDNATDRANLLLAYQLLWKQSCGDNNESDSVDCRANAFKRMLQHRLSSLNYYDDFSEEYTRTFKMTVQRNWNRLWPKGLHIPDPDLPNREPLHEHTIIPPSLDPLHPRQPLETWVAEEDFEQIIPGLAEQITREDVDRIDRHIFETAGQEGAEEQTLEARCRVSRLASRGYGDQYGIECDENFGEDSNPFTLRANFNLSHDSDKAGEMAWLQTSISHPLLGLRLVARSQQHNEGESRAKFDVYYRESDRHARVAEGMAIKSLELVWTGELSGKADVALTLIDDFSLVDQAVTAVAQNASPDDNVFSTQPFNANRIMAAIYKQLGLPDELRWIAGEKVMPAPELDQKATPAPVLSDAEPVRLFIKNCATCHRTDAGYPPSFLSGTAQQIKATLNHCAERIQYRLSMWQLDEEQRPKTPMPPISTISSVESGIERWRDSEDLSRMLAYVTDLVGDDVLTPPSTTNYEHTRSCLP